MTDEKLVLIDIDVMSWTVSETRAYRKAVGVNPEFAIGMLQRAAKESQAEQAADSDADSEDYLPLPLLNIDPAYLLGFAWMAARREDRSLAFDTYADEINTGELMSAFYSEVAGPPEEAAPLVEKPKARKSPSPSPMPSPSAGSTEVGPSET